MSEETFWLWGLGFITVAAALAWLCWRSVMGGTNIQFAASEPTYSPTLPSIHEGLEEPVADKWQLRVLYARRRAAKLDELEDEARALGDLRLALVCKTRAAIAFDRVMHLDLQHFEIEHYGPHQPL